MKNSILFLDDDETFSDISRQILESNDYAVDTVLTVEAAEEALHRSTPDLIISDIEMPGRNGYDFFRLVHDQPQYQGIPFIFLTASNDVESISRGKELGSDDYLLKPVNYKLLLSSIKGKLKKKTILSTAQARQVDAIKHRLFQMVSHEMRTPLTSIIGATELLADPEAEFSAQELTTFLSMLNSNSKRLSRLFDDFLVTARIESGDIRSEITGYETVMSPMYVINAVLQLMQEKMTERNISVTLQAPKEDRAFHISEAHLENILLRFIENAVKFSPTGGTIGITATFSPEACLFRVQDQGCGIAPEHHDAIFEKFHQIDRKKHEQQGPGLGLFIARSLSEANRCRIWLESAPDAGSTFYLQCPIH